MSISDKKLRQRIAALESRINLLIIEAQELKSRYKEDNLSFDACGEIGKITGLRLALAYIRPYMGGIFDDEEEK